MDTQELERRNAELERELRAAVEQVNEGLTQSLELRAQAEELRTRVADAKRLQKEYVKIRNSLMYRMGELIARAFTQPGKRTLLLPYHALRLVLESSVVPKWARIEKNERR